jgi:malonate transporter
MSVALLLLPDFMLIVGGALLKRRGGFGAPFWSGVERLVYFVLFPALLFRSLAHAPLSLGAAGRLVAVGLAFTLGGMALSALARPLFGLPRPTFAACFQCGFRFNTYVALAAASRLGGEAALATISVLVGVLVPVVNFAAIGMLAHGHRGRIVPELARNPLVLACVAGFAWHLTGWPLPEVVAHLVDLLASAALPLGLLAVGAGLTLGRATLPLPALAWWSAVKLVAVPSIALAAAHLAGLPPLERAAAVVLAAVPTAPSAYILAMQMTGHGAPVAILISTGTVLAAGTLPLWLEVIGPLAGP